MAVVPAAKVKALCTASEAALVRASRKGEIEQLPAARLKQHAARAKKLADKWKDLGRGQSRTRGRELGTAEAEANTQLKAQIFSDAQQAFESQLAKAVATPKKAASLKAAAKKAAPATPAAKRATKKVRSAEHRVTRASTRKELTAKEAKLNARPRKASK